MLSAYSRAPEGKDQPENVDQVDRELRLEGYVPELKRSKFSLLFSKVDKEPGFAEDQEDNAYVNKKYPGSITTRDATFRFPQEMSKED